MGEGNKKRGFVHLKINTDKFKIELSGQDAHKCLKEINKILDKVSKATTEGNDEITIDYKLENILSDELLFNTGIAKALNSLSQIYQDYRTNRVAIEHQKIVELEKGKVENTLNFAEIKKAVSKLLYHVQNDSVKHAIVHIKGAIKKDEAKKVLDLIGHTLTNAEVHTLITKSDVPSHTIVEGVFFGEFGTEHAEE